MLFLCSYDHVMILSIFLFIEVYFQELYETVQSFPKQQQDGVSQRELSILGNVGGAAVTV